MTVRLRPMTAEDLPAVMVLEEELFAPDTWTEAMYRDELSRADTRYYVVAEFHLEGDDDDEPEDVRRSWSATPGSSPTTTRRTWPPSA